MNLIYPGSFDPITNGHLDIIRRSAVLADTLYIAVMMNHSKSPMFSIEERVDLIQQVTSDIDNVVVITFKGLLVNVFKTYPIDAIVKGLRAISDFEYEFQMAQINREMQSRAETLFMMTNPEWGYLSSSLVREIHALGGGIDQFAPPQVVAAMNHKLEER